MEASKPDEIVELRRLLVETTVVAVKKPKEVLGKLRELEAVVARLEAKTVARGPSGGETMAVVEKRWP